MTTTRRVRAGAIDTSTLETPIMMVAGEVEQKPMPIEYAGDEPDDTMAFMLALAAVVAVFLIFIGATIWAS